MGTRKPCLVGNRCSRLHSLHHPRGDTYGDTEWGDILRDDCTGSNCAPLSNCCACQYSDSTPDPAIIANQDLTSKFQSVPTRLNARFVCGAEDTHVRPERNPISYDDEGAVEHCSASDPAESVYLDIGRATSVVNLLEICIEVIPDTYIATVIDKNRWLKVDIGSNRTKKLAQDGLPVGSKFTWDRFIWYGGTIVL